MDLSFIILNYQSEQYLDKCLSSLKKNAKGFKYEIIIVNNNPQELSLSTSNSSIQILNTFSNLGFARGCNLGAKDAKGKILFFLNPDTELRSDNLIEFLPLLNHQDIGIIAPSLILQNGKPQPWSGGKKITPLKTILKNIFCKKTTFFAKKSNPTEVDWVSGAAFLIKKTFFKKINGFDEKFFMYFEDVDLCWRVQKLGSKIISIPNFIVLHHGGKSAESGQTQKKLYFQSQDYYFQKHFGKVQAFLFKLMRELFLKIKNFLFPKDSASALFSFFIAFCAFLPMQFALNPAATIDLAIIRVLIPVLFFFVFFLILKNKLSLTIKNKSVLLIFIFLALSVFSVFFSQNILWSLRKLAFLFSIFPIYFIALFLLESDQRKRAALIALVFGATLVSLFALVQFNCQFFFGIEQTYAFLAQNIIPFFLGHNFSREVLTYPSWLVSSGGITYMRAFAPFPDPHMLSYYVGMLIPWSIALWATSKSHKYLFLLFSALLIICDITTFTRGSYLALIASAIIILPLVTRQTAWKIMLGILAFVFLFYLAPKNAITSPVASRMSATFDLSEGSNQSRLAIWKKGFSTLLRNPQGVGVGSYPLTVDSNATYRTPIYTHNLYLDIAVETGILNALIFILLLLNSLRNFWQASKNNSFYLAGFASLTIFAVHSLVENPLYSVHVLPLLLIIFAISFFPKQNPI